MNISYKKEDYLSAKQYAAHYDTPIKFVKTAMEFAYKRHIAVKIKSLTRELVFKPTHQSSFVLRPEPQAQQKFAEILQRFIIETKKGK